MDSFNLFKGYGKVHDDQHLEGQDQAPKPNNTFNHKIKPLIATISIFSILFLTLTIAFMLGALVHHSNTEPPETPNSAAAAAAIKSVCNVTRFPDSCFSAINNTASFHPNPTDPEAILKLSLEVSINELSNLLSFLKTMASNSKGPALSDCKDQVDDALSRLNDSLSAMEVVSGEKVLTDAKINDIQTWISAAVTDQQTCVDGLEEMESAVVGEVKNKMQRSNEYASNSLAIVANIRTLLQQFHMPLH